MSGVEIFGGLEIGSSSLKLVVGAIDLGRDTVSVIGCKEMPYESNLPSVVVKGEIQDIDTIKEMIRVMVPQVERELSVQISLICVGVTGGHVKSQTNDHSEYPSNPNGVVNDADIKNVLERAKKINLPPSSTLLHTHPRRYLVNGNSEVTNLVGQTVQMFKIESQIVSCGNVAIDAACAALSTVMANDVNVVAYNGYAQMMSALTTEDKQRGTLLIDLGAAVTEYSVYQGGRCMHIAHIPVGCQHIINDISLGLELPYEKCEAIFMNHARALASHDNGTRMFEFEQSIDLVRSIPVESVEKITEARLRELFEEIRYDLDQNHVLERIGYKMVITGGGAKIPEINQLLRNVICNVPANTGLPVNVKEIQDTQCNDPRFVTAIGLLLYLQQALKETPYELKYSIWRSLRDFFVGLKNAFRF